MPAAPAPAAGLVGGDAETPAVAAVPLVPTVDGTLPALPLLPMLALDIIPPSEDEQLRRQNAVIVENPKIDVAVRMRGTLSEN
jgi:hypothetical protein